MSLPPRPTYLSDLEFVRVFTTYVHSAPLVRDRFVLDAGAGSGHGSWLYRSAGARRVVAVDLDPAGLREIGRYGGGLECAVMDVEALGLAGPRFDVLACFEVIEHVPQPQRLLAELRRVALPSALVLISTPNRVNRLRPGQRPWNPEHFREYDLAGLRAELGRWYPSVTVLGTYGREDLHLRYLREWSVGTGESRLRALARRAVPHGVRRALRGALVRRDSGSGLEGVPDPVASTWPFWVDEASDRCLNFVAMCGDDPAAVSAAAAVLRRSARPA